MKQYTKKELNMIYNFYELYFLALAHDKGVETQEEFNMMAKVNLPLLDMIVDNYKDEESPNEEMGKDFAWFTTNLLIDRFGMEKVSVFVDVLEERKGRR